MASVSKRPLNLALQGGGAHGAFTWGVLDRLLEESDLDFTAISGTSAGAMNAVVMAEGLIEGGPEHARAQLEHFWLGIADAAERMMPFRQMPMFRMFEPFMYEASLFYARVFSPYDLGAAGPNPLRAMLDELIDFERVRKNCDIRLFINTTHVATGGLRCWREHELTADMVLASACLPSLFQTPIIDGEGYWDGGYVANPAIEPMCRATRTDDVLIVQLNPIVRNELPTKAADIVDRISEISFNASLVNELRFIAERNRLVDSGDLNPTKYRKTHLHMIHGDRMLDDLGPASKLIAEREFFLRLKQAGREAAEAWLAGSGASLGKHSSFDYRRLVAQLTQESDEKPDPGTLLSLD